ncbi:hypothetical protein [Streptomyces sp. NPDC052535]
MWHAAWPDAANRAQPAYHRDRLGQLAGMALVLFAALPATADHG